MTSGNNSGFVYELRGQLSYMLYSKTGLSRNDYHDIVCLKFIQCNIIAKRGARNFKFHFCRTAALQIKFIHTTEYAWHPPTNTSNFFRVLISLKELSQLIGNNENCFKIYFFCQSILYCLLKAALLCQHSKSVNFGVISNGSILKLCSF